jgi:hypothetical protein
MNSLTFNKDSWHYKIATKVVGYRPRNDDDWYEGASDNNDMCTYTRHVMGALLLISVGIALGLYAFYALVEVILGIAFSLMYWSWMFSSLGAVGFVFLSIVSAAYGIKTLVNRINESRLMNRREYFKHRLNGIVKPDGFIKNAYKSWKEKYCVRIEFKD